MIVPTQVLVYTREVVPTQKFFSNIKLGAKGKYTVPTRRPIIMKDLVEKSHYELGINDNDSKVSKNHRRAAKFRKQTKKWHK